MKKKISKKWISLASLLLIGAVFSGSTLLASAAKQNQAEATARQLVPQGAVLQKTEKEADAYEFTFYDEAANAEYEVTVSRKSGAAKKLEAEFFGVTDSETLSASEAEVTALVQERYPGAEILFLQSGLEDGLYSYEVSFRTDTLHGSMELNASTLEILEYTLKYGTPIVIPSEGNSASESSSLLTAAAIRGVIEESYPGCTIYSIELDYDDGRYEYEAAFYADSIVYEIDYDAQTGEVIRTEQKQTGWKPQAGTQETASGQNGTAPSSSAAPDSAQGSTAANGTQASNTPASSIDQETAAGIVLGKAEGTDPIIRKIKLEHDDGQLFYEGEMTDSAFAYAFKIDAYTGTIVKWKKEALEKIPETNASVIGEEKAREIALKKAGSGASVTECRLDTEKGRLYYELELKDSFFEYEAEIDAYTGAILDWDQEPHHKP